MCATGQSALFWRLVTRIARAGIAAARGRAAAGSALDRAARGIRVRARIAARIHLRAVVRAARVAVVTMTEVRTSASDQTGHSNNCDCLFHSTPLLTC